MKKKILITILAITLLAGLSCTKLVRDNPFDPSAAGKTTIFSDNFEVSSIGNTPFPPWAIYDSAMNGIKFHVEMQMPAMLTRSLRVDYSVSINSMVALYQDDKDALRGKVLAQFDMALMTAAMMSTGGASVAFEIAGDGDSTSVKAGFGFDSTMMNNTVNFFTEDGTSKKNISYTGDVNKRYIISIVFDFNKNLMSVWIDDGNQKKLVAENVSVSLPSKASRYQFRVFSSTTAGGSPYADIDNFNIIRVGSAP